MRLTGTGPPRFRIPNSIERSALATNGTILYQTALTGAAGLDFELLAKVGRARAASALQVSAGGGSKTSLLLCVLGHNAEYVSAEGPAADLRFRGAEASP